MQVVLREKKGFLLETFPDKCFRLILLTSLLAVLTFLTPHSLRADPVAESDISPSLLVAIKDVTSLVPVFPLDENDTFFQLVSLDLTGKSITSLKGIKYFNELTRLTLDHNRLTSLKDIAFPDNIRYLSLAHNNIADISQTSWPARLRTLDLRNNRLTSPLDTTFPDSVSSIVLDNNFLNSKLVSAPKECSVTFAGNFIYEANAIRPASLVVEGVNAISFSPGEQKAIPFVSITTTTNPNNQVPPKLLTAQIASEQGGPIQLSREEYRFLVAAQNAGSDFLVISLDLSNYWVSQYERMNQTFYKVTIPVTVWQSAENRPGAASANNGDAAVLTALSGRSSHAVADMTRFPDGRASFSPGLLAQLANQDQKLILSHDFGNLTLDPKTLRSIAAQAGVSSDADIYITLNTYDLRPIGLTPSRFSDREIAILPCRDFDFSVKLDIPGSEPKDIDIGSPVTAVLYMMNQPFTPWDLSHLVAFKDNTTILDLLGGTYSSSSVSFSYQLNGLGRFGIGTRGTLVKWIDLAINSTQYTRSDGTTGAINPAPLIHRGSTMVPLRSVFEELGATVTWHESMNSTTISNDNISLSITEGKPIGGSDQIPITVNGRILGPLRLISTEFGATVLWWGQEGRIRIVY